MKSYLDSFSQDIGSVAKKPAQLLGQVALQSAYSVFWVRDAVWVKIEADVPVEDFWSEGTAVEWNLSQQNQLNFLLR